MCGQNKNPHCKFIKIDKQTSPWYMIYEKSSINKYSNVFMILSRIVVYAIDTSAMVSPDEIRFTDATQFKFPKFCLFLFEI